MYTHPRSDCISFAVNVDKKNTWIKALVLFDNLFIYALYTTIVACMNN